MATDVSNVAIRLAQAIAAGQRRALAQCCSLAESIRDDDQELLSAVLAELPAPARHTRRVAVTGAPGVGKSSFVERWGTSLINAGHSVAVLAIDPSSRRTGGSILGDKTRMQVLANSSHAFVRPQPSGTHLGGTARATRLCIPLCEAAGYDTIIVETVGVGQSEVEVADMVDLCLLLVLPTAGDDVQAIKRGIMEVADVVAVTKSDLDPEASRRAAAMLSGAMRLLQPSSEEWTSRVVLASAVDQDGLTEVDQSVADYFSDVRHDMVMRRRRRQQVRWYDDEVVAMMRLALLANSKVSQTVGEMREAIVAGRLTVPHASSAVVKVIQDVLKQGN